MIYVLVLCLGASGAPHPDLCQYQATPLPYYDDEASCDHWRDVMQRNGGFKPGIRAIYSCQGVDTGFRPRDEAW